MKLKFFIISKLESGPSTACFETEFNPIRNIQKLLFLINYCKPLLRASNSEEHFNICEELFDCAQGYCKIDGLSIVPIEKNDYDNFCLINIENSSYCWIKNVKFIDYLSVYSTQEWLELHYPLEQFFNETPGQLDERSRELKSLIQLSNKYDNLCGDELLSILELIEIN